MLATEQSFTVVPSLSGKSDEYTVTQQPDGSFTCTCPHWVYRLQGTGQECKHILLAKAIFKPVQGD